MPDSVLITGGGGFIGANTAEALVSLGYEVVVLDDGQKWLDLSWKAELELEERGLALDGSGKSGL